MTDHTQLAYLGLGGNLGDRHAALREAIQRLDREPGVAVRRVAAIRETAPWGVAAQPPFLNTVVEIETSLAPEALLDVAKRIEQAMGREPSYRWGPRLIDIDLLWVAGERRDSPTLTLPHPGIVERDFVREPLEELNPALVEELRSAAVPL